jgi:hypothetical protein
MSANNGVIRVGRKGKKKFAFGEDGAPFEVDVVVAFQQWISIDEEFRIKGDDRTIPLTEMHEYHQAAVEFVKTLATDPPADLTVAEALDFIARLREQYDEVSNFFRPKLQDERESPVTSGAETRFSVEQS